MRLISILILVFAITCPSIDAQNRHINGRIIIEDYETLPGASIMDSDTNLLGTTDMEGRFSLEIPPETDTLQISFIAMEWKTIAISTNCDTIDIIVMYDAIYDFMTASKIDRLRLKRFKKLPEIHKTAYEKGLFTTQQPCYTQSFTPIKSRLKEIHKKRKS